LAWREIFLAALLVVAFVPMKVPEVKWRIAVLGFEFRGLIVDFGFWRMWFWILDVCLESFPLESSPSNCHGK